MLLTSVPLVKRCWSQPTLLMLLVLVDREPWSLLHAPETATHCCFLAANATLKELPSSPATGIMPYVLLILPPPLLA